MQTQTVENTFAAVISTGQVMFVICYRQFMGSCYRGIRVFTVPGKQRFRICVTFQLDCTHEYLTSGYHGTRLSIVT